MPNLHSTKSVCRKIMCYISVAHKSGVGLADKTGSTSMHFHQ